MKSYRIENINGIEFAVPEVDYQRFLDNFKFSLRLKNSGIPKSYHELDWNDYYGNKSKNEALKIQYIAEHIHDEQCMGVSLYIWGINNGTQKTSSACYFGKECIRKGLVVKFENFGNLVRNLMLNQGFNRDDDSSTKLVSIKNADVIILDDCFDPKKSLLWEKESSRNLIVGEIDSFLRQLFDNEKHVVFTSNVSIGCIEETYGRSLMDLIDRNTEKFQMLDRVSELKKEKSKIDYGNLFGKDE